MKLEDGVIFRPEKRVENPVILYNPVHTTSEKSQPLFGEVMVILKGKIFGLLLVECDLERRQVGRPRRRN